VAALSSLVAARGSQAAAQAPSGSGSGTNTLILVGGLGLGAVVLRARGVALLDDLMYVSRASFKQGVSTLGNGLQSVSTALARVRTVLSDRLDALTARVEEGLAAQTALAADAAAARAGVGELGAQMAQIASGVDEVESKLVSVGAKQDFACRGIYLLCSVVSQTLKDAPGGGGGNGGEARGKQLPAAGGGGGNTAASLAALLGSHVAGGDTAAAAAPMTHLGPLTGTVQEQLAAISSLAAVNLNLAACA
jgi:hypothetical protein